MCRSELCCRSLILVLLPSDWVSHYIATVSNFAMPPPNISVSIDGTLGQCPKYSLVTLPESSLTTVNIALVCSSVNVLLISNVYNDGHHLSQLSWLHRGQVVVNNPQRRDFCERSK